MMQILMCHAPVLSERHIGLDQGYMNFGIAVVEKYDGSVPKIVAAENYTDLHLAPRFSVTDVLLALMQKTDLTKWLQPSNAYSNVDRIIVHLEQISIRNRHWKQFSIELGRLLQQQTTDARKCIVKMSQPHIHRKNGPIYHLGNRLLEILHLDQSGSAQSGSLQATAANSSVRLQARQHMSDVEPSDDESTDDGDDDEMLTHDPTSEYRAKKKISADIFKYVIGADHDQ